MAYGTAITASTKENLIKKTFEKRFVIPLDFDFFKHPVYPYSIKENLIARLEVSFSEKVILCSRDCAAANELSNISLGYEAIFDEIYAASIGELYARATSIPYTKVKLIHY